MSPSTSRATAGSALDVLDSIPDAAIPAAIARLAARAMVPLPAGNTLPAPADELLTPAETAKLLKLDDVRQVYRRAKSLGAIHMGRRLRFSRRKVLARLAAH